MTDENPRKLSDEDLARVKHYLSGPVQRVDRKPFRPWLLLFWLCVVVVILGVISQMLGRIEGYL